LFFSRNKIEGYKKTNTMYTNLKETRQDLRKKSDVSAQIKIMDEDKEQIMSIFVLLLFLYFLILVLVRLKLLFFFLEIK
jgi:hypothetical protein